MKKILGKYAEPIYALMRIVVGLLFLCHGAQKLFGAFGGEPVDIASLKGMAGIIELVGGVLVMIGLFASTAAFIASGQMAVAYFMVHFPQSFWPIENGGGLAVLYCFIFLYIAAKGAGMWSVARALGKPGWE